MAYRVVIPYATDFDELSPGGIRSYIEVIAENVPENVELTLLGIQGKKKVLRVHKGKFVGLNAKAILGRLNLGFLIQLAKSDLSQFNLVLCHRAETALLVKLLHRKKVFLTLHGGTFNAMKGNHKIFGFVYPFIEFLACFLSDSVNSVNIALINPFIRNSCKVRLAPLLVRQDLFFPSERIGNEIFLIGRLESEKRFDLALQILNDAQRGIDAPLKVNIVGDGSCRKALIELAKQLNLETIFHGQKTQMEVAELMRNQGKILMLTSKFEGAPIVAVEALLTGLHVIALRSTGISDNLANLGVKIASGNGELINCIREIMSNNNRNHITPNYVREILASNPYLYWSECVNLMQSNENSN